MAIGVGSLSGRSSSAAAGHQVERRLPNAGETTAPPSRNARVATMAPWMTAIAPERKRRRAVWGGGHIWRVRFKGSTPLEPLNPFRPALDRAGLEDPVVLGVPHPVFLVALAARGSHLLLHGGHHGRAVRCRRGQH